MTYRKAAELDDLWDGEMLGCQVNGRKILLVRLDGQVHAYENRCAHQGVPLSEGSLDGHVLTCRAHHWQYNARNGEGINPAAARLKAVPVAVANGEILVDTD